MVTYLIGTCHLDLKGPARLKKFLNFVRPTSIGHENSLESVKSLAENRKRKSVAFLHMNSEVDQTLKFAIMLEYIYGYEIWMPYQHQQDDNPTTTIYPLENCQTIQKATEYFYQQSSTTDSKTLSDWEIILNEGLRTMDLKKVQNGIDLAYFDPRMAENIQKKLERIDYILQDREVLIEQKIREIVANDAQGTTVAICGVAHIFGGHHNLYERLMDISPCRIRLPDVDKF